MSPATRQDHLTDWCAFSTTDMETWTEHPTPLKSTDFAWNVTNDAWAAHVTERDANITTISAPAVQAYIFWGNRYCYYAKLKRNMTEIEGEITKLAYAMSDSIHGPWEFKGLLSECAGNCNTTHPSIVELNGKTYMFTHNGTLPEGTSYSRSVTVEEIRYNPDGTMQKCDVTTKGINGKGW